MKYAVFNKKGLPQGFYDKEIHDKIPQNAVEITDEQWQEFLQNQGKLAWIENRIVNISNKRWDDIKKEWRDKTTQEILLPLQKTKLNQLKSDFNTLRNQTAHITSKTINKPINARQQDLINIDSLISILPDNTTTLQFRCYDNIFVNVTKPQLEAIKKELIQAGMEMYKRKWLLEQKIEKAQTVANLEKIKWDSDLNEVDST